VLIAKIQELYIIVYQKEKITNNIIALRFTMGLLVKKKRYVVNWALFAQQAQKPKSRRDLRNI